jgi:fatty acid desaturase
LTFDELSRELRQRGYFHRPTGRVLFELAIHLALFFGGLWIVIAADGWFLKLVGLIVNVAGVTGIATNTHTSAHFATSDNRWVNVLLVYIGYPILGQFSISYWWRKHNTVHHRLPNIEGHDHDVNWMPAFSYTARDVEGVGRLRGLYYRYQGLLLPFALLLNGINVQTYDWRYLWPILRDPERRSLLHVMDAVGLVAHWVVWVILPSFLFPLVSVILFNVAHRALFGVAIFIFFAPAHYPAEAVVVDESQMDEDPLLLQTATVVNFRTGPIGALFCGGVQYQIEHHLFPNICHVYYPRLSGLVREFCESNGYPYRTLGWGEALWKSYLVFWSPKKVEPRVEDCRLRDDSSLA